MGRRDTSPIVCKRCNEIIPAPLHGPYCSACRFWRKVDKNGPLVPGMKTRCWVWTGLQIWSGYGSLTHKRKPFAAHRMSWILRKGPVPKGKCVLHRCDNRLCVRHLFIGTNADNSADMTKKSRQAKGENQGSAKLTETLVCKMRTMRLAGSSIAEIARTFNVAEYTTKAAVRGETWRHVTKVPPVAKGEDGRKLNGSAPGHQGGSRR